MKLTTVKASDLALDDDGMSGDIEFMPEIKAGQLLDGDMHIEMPDMPTFQRLPIDLERIRLRLPEMKLQDLQRSLQKLKTLPIEYYDNGVHRI